VVAVAFRSLLRVCTGSSGAYNLTVRSSRRRFMASCYLSVSGCCRFGCTSLRRGLTQVLGLMVKWIAPATNFLRVAAIALAVTWGYASHKYDCFNIGPCRGNATFWVNLNTVACYAFVLAWLSLVGLAWSARGRPWRQAAATWFAAVVAPPAVFFLASSAFNMGVSANGG